jgi:DNA-binding HxlR family transcriptional regulator
VVAGDRAEFLAYAQKYSYYISVSSDDAMTPLTGLVTLCHRKWTIPLVAALAPGGGDRFAVLGARLGVARETLKRAIETAIELELVARNPGYGHPLRPEYLLTARGAAIGTARTQVIEAAGGRWAEPLGRKWFLPTLVAVGREAERFSDVAAALDGATPRALARSLEDLVEAGCVRRDLVDGRTPRPRYRVTRAGRPLADAGLALAIAMCSADRFVRV